MSVPRSVKIAGKTYIPGADRGVSVLLTAASWVLQRLPGQVLEEQRGELIRTLNEARDVTVEIRIASPTPSRLRTAVRRIVTRRAAEEPLKGSRTLGDLAAVRLLEIRCGRCGRRGRESIARLIGRYGRETPLPDLRNQLAADCPNRQAGIHERCDVYFPQLAEIQRDIDE